MHGRHEEDAAATAAAAGVEVWLGLFGGTETEPQLLQRRKKTQRWTSMME